MGPLEQFPELYESNRQAVGAWKRFARGTPEGDVRETTGVICAFSNVPLAFFNMGFLSSPVLNLNDLNDRIASVNDYGSKCAFPWMFVSCNEWLPEFLHASQHEAFSRHGLHAAMTLTGMVTDVVSPSAVAVPQSRMDYRRVESRETCFAISDINCAAYEIPLEIGRQSILEGMFGADVFAYVGYLEEKPVTAAGVWIVDGILYVAMVATHPDHRRKGYAEAVMRHALQEARKATGITRTVLHATEAGLPVYERMAYRSVARFTVYEPHEQTRE